MNNFKNQLESVENQVVDRSVAVPKAEAKQEDKAEKQAKKKKQNEQEQVN